MTEQNTFILIVPAYVTSRFAMSYLTSTMPYARAGGGTGRPFVENAKTSDAVVAFIFAVVLNFAVAGVIGVLMLLVGLFAAFLLKLFYMKKVGGVTGDLLGAASEMIETILLIFGAIVGAHIGVFRF
jgi:adenosylcobinamide-GDP ribazoletransferase